jgi:NodT family efflux transporter outer membrane factor (OMF) lipoprotein
MLPAFHNHTFRNITGKALVVAACLLTGCIKVGPDYVRPEINLAGSWRNSGNRFADNATALQLLSSWWTIFQDDKLTALIGQAIAGNLDIKKAQARLREARAKQLVVQADLFPSLNATGSAKRNKSWSDQTAGTTAGIQDSASAILDASWELDIFGGTRRSVEAASANAQAVREDLRDVLVSLIAEVASNYLSLRTTQSRIETTQSSINTQNETYQLVLWGHEAGLVDGLAVQQAKYNLESTRAQLPTLRTQLEQYLNRIAVLLGEQPEKVSRQLLQGTGIPSAPAEVAAGVPAGVLRQRPDVRRAERELAAQSARIGVATAELYPSFTLNGSIGVETLSTNHQGSSKTWNLIGGPQVSWAVFTAGAICQNIEIQKALYGQAKSDYESTILTALEDVENALTAFAQEQVRCRSLQEGTLAARSAVDLSRAKYRAGLTDFYDVLDAERSLYSLQDQLVQSSGAVSINLVSLYKALGGGWQAQACAAAE